VGGRGLAAPTRHGHVSPLPATCARASHSHIRRSP
jgi:hypothetical protein